MRIFPPKPRRSKAGYLLSEVALGMMLCLGVAATTVAMAGQHVRLVTIINSYKFLRDEAPSINLLMGRLIQRSDFYRIYSDKASAFSNTGAVTSGGSAVMLRFRNPDGSTQDTVIAFEPTGARPGLNLYNRTGSGWPGVPDWTVSSRPTAVNFSNDTGILLIQVTGPDSEKITYVGNSE